MIEYDPPKTRNGFLPGDLVAYFGRRGVVLYSRHVLPGNEWVGVEDRAVEVAAKDLTLLSDDTGDPEPVRAKCNSLRGIAKMAHDIARAKGFYAELDFARAHLAPDVGITSREADARVLAFIERLWLFTRCALIHSEVSEMIEAIREGKLNAYTWGGKPEGLPSEMADVIIRLADLAGGCGVDLDRAVAEKAAYNATRPKMHGGKKA